MEGKKPFSLKKWAKSRKGQQVIICVAFMTIPLLLLFVFTYLPFAEMVKFSFFNSGRSEKICRIQKLY